ALMYIYMGHMGFEQTKPYEDWFWKKNKIDLIRAYVTDIDTEFKRLHLKDGRIISYDKLLIATGSKSNKFGWPGQDLPGVQGLYSYQDLELLEANTQNISRAVIVGGGLIGIELAEMLLSRHIPVTFLVREHFYWDNVLPMDEARLISNHVREHGIDLRLKTNLKAILPDETGRVRAVVTEYDEEIPCQFVGLTPGVHPNIDLAKTTKVETSRGILVNDYLETNIPDVYAAGDCAEIIVEGEQRNRIEQLWYTARKQGAAVAKTICGSRTEYEKGIWFNSAKFFDIEYQTYGFVNNIRRDEEESFYWEHPAGKHCARFVCKKDTKTLVGMNFFGMRMRHSVCDSWIREGKTLEYVLQHLPAANFDPEFFKKYEGQIIESYNQQNGRQLKLKDRSGLFSKIFTANYAGA
ncbi:FAD-dependent oxidoreductase, partial [Candidatus Saccharibacteria bacterium]|nr:FAD-dependent oxidoreductase [Calditrichia bacterium]NIW00319.1 FAD-dependent oxidoreductase [Candidatus Saccharibacteria bacterium]NIW80684.1 FAD-dependent oxidoreductase [Calditrichia bacterium]